MEVVVPLLVSLVPLAMLAAGAAMTLHSLRTLWRGLISWSWPSVAGKVLTSKVEWDDSGEATVSYPVVTYAYRVDGKKHRSDQVAFGLGRWSPKRAEKIVARYPVGAIVVVRHHPTRPARAVLMPGVRLGAIVGLLLGGLMTWLGVATLVALYHGFR